MYVVCVCVCVVFVWVECVCVCVCLYVCDVPFVNLCGVHDVRFFRACGMIAWCECVSGTVS